MPLALVSLYDKTGFLPFAQRLARAGWSFLASGGTAQTLRSAGIEPLDVAVYTGSAEMLGGRVKTLHPAIHASILARPSDSDLAELEARGWKPIDMVVVNLYPFERTAADPSAGVEEIIEQIDIGGVALLRAAAKNHARVCVVCDSADYDVVAGEAEAGGISPATRQRLAAKAFARTADYDAAIARWFARHESPIGPELAAQQAQPSESFVLAGRVERSLRYGENPHQKAFFVMPADSGRDQGPLGGRVLAGKELSYNNILDLDAAWRAVLDFEKPAAVIVKHLSPCGAGEADELSQAYRLALECDPLSAFGGIAAFNRPLDAATAGALKDLFLECIAAPAFDEKALQLLASKKNLRLVEADPALYARVRQELRSAAGGILVQEPDRGDPPDVSFRVMSNREPSEEELEALRFAWRLVRHVKSNAIVLARGRAAVGIGGGQTSRVDAVRQACERAGMRAKGAVMASDAFFPFPDGIEAAAAAGVTAVIHPGGSIRDDEILAAANRLGLALISTGIRHFRH